MSLVVEGSQGCSGLWGKSWVWFEYKIQIFLQSVFGCSTTWLGGACEMKEMSQCELRHPLCSIAALHHPFKARVGPTLLEQKPWGVALGWLHSFCRVFSSLPALASASVGAVLECRGWDVYLRIVIVLGVMVSCHWRLVLFMMCCLCKRQCVLLAQRPFDFSAVAEHSTLSFPRSCSPPSSVGLRVFAQLRVGMHTATQGNKLTNWGFQLVLSLCLGESRKLF